MDTQLLLSAQRRWELPRNKLRFSSVLGEGNFGVVGEVVLL